MRHLKRRPGRRGTPVLQGQQRAGGHRHGCWAAKLLYVCKVAASGSPVPQTFRVTPCQPSPAAATATATPAWTSASSPVGLPVSLPQPVPPTATRTGIRCRSVSSRTGPNTVAWHTRKPSTLAPLFTICPFVPAIISPNSPSYWECPVQCRTPRPAARPREDTMSPPLIFTAFPLLCPSLRGHSWYCWNSAPLARFGLCPTRTGWEPFWIFIRSFT